VRRILLACALALVALLGSRAAPAAYGPPPPPTPTHGKAGPVLLSWRTMYGVGGPFLGAAHAQRGVSGDGMPWVLKSATGSLTTGGHLRISVKRLVFANSLDVPENLRGINDEPEFRGLVSCVAVNGDSVVESNVMTDGFRASPKGDSKIDAWLELPDPCVSPVVMVLAGSSEVWFAATGFITGTD
jgi:hypothetical protein